MGKNVSGVLITRGERVLLSRLLSKREVGRYSVPGGVIEPGENPAEATVREAGEETTLRINPSNLVPIYLGAQVFPDAIFRYTGFLIEWNESMGEPLNTDHAGRRGPWEWLNPADVSLSMSAHALIIASSTYLRQRRILHRDFHTNRKAS